MFENAGAKPPSDAGVPPPGAVSADENSASLANSETVGHWLEQLPERSWDHGPGE